MCSKFILKRGCLLSHVELEDEPSLGDVQRRVVPGMLKDGIAVEPRTTFEHHKPEPAVLEEGSRY